MSEDPRRPGYSLDFVKRAVAEAEGREPQRLPEFMRRKLEILMLAVFASGGVVAITEVSQFIADKIASAVKENRGDNQMPTAEELQKMDKALEIAFQNIKISMEDEDVGIGPFTQK
jgi:hypothetical protein